MPDADDIDLVFQKDIDNPVTAFDQFADGFVIVFRDHPAGIRVAADLPGTRCDPVHHAPGIIRGIVRDIIMNANNCSRAARVQRTFIQTA